MWAYCDFLPFFLWVFGAELPHEQRWKESLIAGSCLDIIMLKTGVLGGACSSIAVFEVW